MAAPKPGHHAAAEQARRPRAAPRGSTFVACPAATSVFSANAPIPSAGESSVPSASVIFCVALCVLKQYQGRPRRHARHSPHTARQLRTTKSPGATPVTSGPTASTMPGGLVTEQEREVVVDPALAVVQVGVADTARLHADERLAGTGVGDDDRLDASPARPCAWATTPWTSWAHGRGMYFLSLPCGACPSDEFPTDDDVDEELIEPEFIEYDGRMFAVAAVVPHPTAIRVIMELGARRRGRAPSPRRPRRRDRGPGLLGRHLRRGDGRVHGRRPPPRPGRDAAETFDRVE